MQKSIQTHSLLSVSVRWIFRDDAMMRNGTTTVALPPSVAVGARRVLSEAGSIKLREANDRKSETGPGLRDCIFKWFLREVLDKFLVAAI